jgi:hypothetical protein
MSTPSPADAPRARRADLAAWAGLTLVLLVTVAIRLRLAPMPLERDEGEYAYIGSLLLKGVPPFDGAYTMKLPGTAAAYALALALFGHTPTGVHIGLLIANAASIVLVFLLGRLLFGVRSGVVAAAWFAAASLSPVVLGLNGHATQFVTPLALGGFYLLAARGRPGVARVAAAGALLGAAALMKQSGAAFFLLGVLLVFLDGAKRMTAARRVAVLAVAFACPLLVLLIWFKTAGTLPAAYFWTVTYARAYATLTSADQAIGNLGSAVASWEPGFALVIGLSLMGLLLGSRLSGTGHRFVRVLPAGLLAVGALVTASGWYFRPHYFVPLLPGAALGGAALFAALTAESDTAAIRGRNRLRRVAAFSAAVLPPLSIVAWNAPLFFVTTPVGASEAIYTMEAFPESGAIGRYLREHTAPGEKVAVLGSEPQIYFLADRPAATGYLYMYPLTEPQPYARQMQEQMIAEVNRATPRYVVLVHNETSWAAAPRTDRFLLDWLARFREGYTRVAVTEPVKSGVNRAGTRYIWDERDAARYRPRRARYIEILRRKDAAAPAPAPG